MKKKIIIILLSICATTSFAQTPVPILGDIATLTSGNQQLIEDAVKNSFMVLHTQYQMEDVKTKKRYNAEGNNGFFGETYSLCVKTREGYIAEDAAIHPWEYDSDFEYYRDDKQYRPVVSHSAYRQFADTVYTDQTQTFKAENAKIIIENRLYAITDKKFGNKGLITKALPEETEGWLVWLTADKPLTGKGDAKLTLSIYRFPLKTEKDATHYDVVPKIDKTMTLLGGIYILPEITEIGEISFRLLGTLQRENDKWQLLPVVNGNTKVMVPTDRKPSENDSRRKLTPSKQ